MTSKKRRTYPEIRQEINHLLQRFATVLTEEDEILRQTLPESEIAEVPLQCDDAKKTISWFDSSLRLSRKQYLLIKTLWESENHKADLTEIEEIVWEKELQGKIAIERHAILTLVSRVQTKLEQKSFPYQIEAHKIKILGGQEKPVRIKSPNRRNYTSIEISGYQLIVRSAQENHYRQ
ncbi:MAG: hypothetical protein LBT05_05185 [Planctomycetaceae bacterium]|jgi:DNA-binding response OmpR family regulator|nr:hypothetical protein [Planctomycetaceae bacterium]